MRSASVIVGAFGILVGLVLLPPVFSATLAVGRLEPVERAVLWVAAIGLLVLSSTVAVRRRPVARPVLGLLFGVLILAGMELAVRAVLVATQPAEVLSELSRLADRTYQEKARLRPHPFLQYSGGFGTNNLGYANSPNYAVDKPASTIRVACLGGSTTADQNWPTQMQRWLDERSGEGAPRFEVMNFGRSGYSSAHVAINFFLVVADFDPDYVVLHTGWNDRVFRGLDTEPLPDFSNVFDVMQWPAIPEKWLLRSSVIVRGVLDRTIGLPRWAELQPATRFVRWRRPTFDDPAELAPLRRNVEKVLDFAVAREIVPVLATLPYSTDPSVSDAAQAKHLDQCNALMRRIHEERRATTLLVDLDREMTGVNDEHFEDLAHMHLEGQRLKGVAVGRTLLRDAIARRGRERSNAGR